jgi:hypothetical protein
MGFKSRGIASEGPVGASNAASSRCGARSGSMSSRLSPESTDLGCASTSLTCAKRSRCLMRSHWLPVRVFTSVKEPFTFSPRRKKLSLPALSSARTRLSASARSVNEYFPPSSGEYGPQSQTMTLPAPYCFSGITPSKEA